MAVLETRKDGKAFEGKGRRATFVTERVELVGDAQESQAGWF